MKERQEELEDERKSRQEKLRETCMGKISSEVEDGSEAIMILVVKTS